MYKYSPDNRETETVSCVLCQATHTYQKDSDSAPSLTTYKGSTASILRHASVYTLSLDFNCHEIHLTTITQAQKGFPMSSQRFLII